MIKSSIYCESLNWISEIIFKEYYAVSSITFILNERTDENLLSAFNIKIIVAGDGGVGKTSLLNRYVSNTFMDVMKMTIGTGFFSKVLETEGSTIKLQLWDFGGEKRFRFILPNYCKGAHGVILAFDMNDFTTLMNLDEWLQIIRENTKDPRIMLVGTKSDITMVLDEKFIQEYLKENNIKKFIPTSAKTGENIERIFKELVHDILAHHA